MSKATRRPTTDPRKRTRGRPAVGINGVGRERLLEVAEGLLRTLPPARVSMARVSQAANVDPALVRYYFGDRIALLMSVVDRVTAHELRGALHQEEPVAALADHIGHTVQFTHAAPFMHRVMIDELVRGGTEKSRDRVRDMNRDLVAFYRKVLCDDAERDLITVNPLFLHVAVLGASDLFSSANPIIAELVPEGTDMERLATDFRDFLIKLVLDGLRKR